MHQGDLFRDAWVKQQLEGIARRINAHEEAMTINVEQFTKELRDTWLLSNGNWLGQSGRFRLKRKDQGMECAVNGESQLWKGWNSMERHCRMPVSAFRNGLKHKLHGSREFGNWRQHCSLPMCEFFLLMESPSCALNENTN